MRTLDKSYFDGSRSAICHDFLESMKHVVMQDYPYDRRIIKRIDFTLNLSILDSLLAICPEDEKMLLFWTRYTSYTETADAYEVRYPVVPGLDNDGSQVYMVDKIAFNLFIFCRMYTPFAEESQYVRSKLFNVQVPFIVSAPPSKESIKGDGQMKILTDFIEIAQPIYFEDGDKVLIAGSSSEGGVCAGKSYNILSFMTQSKVDVYLYDPYEIEVTYTVGTVTYHHIRGKYEYDGTESKYRLLIDDIWIPMADRQWDPNNYYALAQDFSIKWFPFYNDDKKHKQRKGYIKYQHYFTKGGEQRYTSIMPKINFKRNDFLGPCAKCTLLKYIIYRDFNIGFFDYILRMHLIHCVTKEKRSFVGEKFETSCQKWYQVEPFDLMLGGWITTPWDIVSGVQVVYPSEYMVKGLRMVFNDKRMVRPDLYLYSTILVVQNGDYYVNKPDDKSFAYLANTMDEDDGSLGALLNSMEKRVYTPIHPLVIVKEEVKKEIIPKNERYAKGQKNKRAAKVPRETKDKKLCVLQNGDYKEHVPGESGRPKIDNQKTKPQRLKNNNQNNGGQNKNEKSDLGKNKPVVISNVQVKGNMTMNKGNIVMNPSRLKK